MPRKTVFMKLYTIIFSGFCLCACSSQSKNTTASESTPIQNLQEEVLEVATVSAQRKAFTYTIQSNAKTEAQEQATLQFRVSGYISKVFVQNGQFVQAGQIVAILDDTEAKLALQKAKNQRVVAYEEYIKEVLDFGGNLQAEHGGISPELNERILARKGVRSAELQIKEAEIQLQYTQLKAPFAGVIADLNLKANNFVTPSQSFCTLYSSTQLHAVAEVLETEVNVLKIGQKAEVLPLGCHEKSVCGTDASIIEINPKVGSNGLFKVKLLLHNPKNIFLGANLQVRMFVPQRESLVVPKSAIVIRSGKKVVFTAEGNLAKWHYVSTGLENGEEVEILDGLKEGEKVIVSNNLQLNHDSPVKVK